VQRTEKADCVWCAVATERFTPESDLDWFAKTLRESCTCRASIPVSTGGDANQLPPLQQAAEETACSVSTLRNLIARGDLPASRFGPRLIRVRRRDLDAILKPYQGGQAGLWSDLA
jgi:excisionase family DNA binding protein